MQALKRKLSHTALRREQQENSIANIEGRKLSVSNSVERNERRLSTDSSTFDSAYEIELKLIESPITPLERVDTIPPERDGSLYQPFTRGESPYPVGRHGLYELSSSDTLPPPLPPAIPGLQYGKTSPVVIPPERFGVPGKVCSMLDVLNEPPPVPPLPPTFLDKLIWKKQQLKARIENSKADPEFAFLPKGLNNRVDSEQKDKDAESLKEKFHRAFGVTPKKASARVVFQELSLPLPFSPDLPTPAAFAAPLRYIPKVAAHKTLDCGVEFDEAGNPFGGEPVLFHETEEERSRRLRQAEEGRKHRKASDHYFSLNGRRPTNDSLIGRPPPLSHRKLSEPSRLTEVIEKRDQKQRERGEEEEELRIALQAWRKVEARYEALEQNAIDDAKRVARGLMTLEADLIDAAEVQNMGPTHQDHVPPLQQQHPRTFKKSSNDFEAAAADAESLKFLEAAAVTMLVPVSSNTTCQLLFTPTSPTNTDLLRRARVTSISGKIAAMNKTAIEQLPSMYPNERSKHSTPVIAANEGSTPQLPEKGSRYFQWDEALRAGKTPVIVAAATPPCTPLLKLPDNSPPPIPSTARHPSPSNALGIFDESALSLPEKLKAVGLHANKKVKHNDYADTGSDYSESLAPENDEPSLKTHCEFTKSSEKFAQSYRAEVDLAYKEVTAASWSENSALLKAKAKAKAVAGDPFKYADNQRQSHWHDAAAKLSGEVIVESPSFTYQRMIDVCLGFQENSIPSHMRQRQDDDIAGSVDDEDDEDDLPVKDEGPHKPSTYHHGCMEEFPEPGKYETFESSHDEFFGESMPLQPHQNESLMPLHTLNFTQHRTFELSRGLKSLGRKPSISERLLNPQRRERSSITGRRQQSPGPREEVQAPADPRSVNKKVHYPPWLSLQEQQVQEDLCREVDPNLLQSKVDTVDDESKAEGTMVPAIVEGYPPRFKPGRIYAQKGRFPVDSAVQSPSMATATTSSSHSRAPAQQTGNDPTPSNNAITKNWRAITPMIAQTQVLRALPSAPLRLTSAPAALPQPHKKSSIWNLKSSFLGRSLTVSGAHPARMESNLQVRPSESSSVKTKAVEDARQMQAKVIEVASKAGKAPPKYALLELIGKGSFGRVYKGKDMTSAAIVAVKIIDIDESDTLNPRMADSYTEFLKEVNALKILSESNAKNINHVIEALPVGQSMWMISEHCGGGSVATLMKPTAPGGLQEKWIIPILREVAEAIKWVHEAGIIHRDIKCANVLITEDGGVQLCDFGVAGIIEGKVDKRSTVIGTPHWMAPELFTSTPYYGKEVDIWAFGSMVFEVATGLPPNVSQGVPMERLGAHFQHHIPRLEGGNYSHDLRDLVAYCLEELPSARPTIEQVQQHPYIHGTSLKYPTSGLSNLVKAFKIWEDHGGSRKSLFMLGGAQGPSGSTPVADDEWNFSTTAAFDQEVLRQSSPQDVFEAYGKGVALHGFFAEETSQPPQKASRRRPPPEALARLPVPLEKIFDPNTLSNYEDNSRTHYGRPSQPLASDLPLRDDTAQTSIRDTMIDLGGHDSMIDLDSHGSMIDLGGHDSDSGISNFPGMDTIKPIRRAGREEVDDDYTNTLHDFSRPTLSDPADVNPNRRTQDWKFPAMAPPASADLEVSRFPESYELPRPAITPASGGRPALIHHPTEPLSSAFAGRLAQQTTMDRLSMRESLIDLDMSMPDAVPTYSRPSTANSDAGSATSEQMALGNPFELERHASLYAPLSSENTNVTDPEYYSEESAFPAHLGRDSATRPRDISEISDFSASDAESSQDRSGFSDSDIPPTRLLMHAPFARPDNLPYKFAHFPDLPAPPSERALSGTASNDEMTSEFNRMLGAMTAQLESFKDVYGSPQVTQQKGPTPQRRDKKDGEGSAGAVVGVGLGG